MAGLAGWLVELPVLPWLGFCRLSTAGPAGGVARQQRH